MLPPMTLSHDSILIYAIMSFVLEGCEVRDHRGERTLSRDVK